MLPNMKEVLVDSVKSINAMEMYVENNFNIKTKMHMLPWIDEIRTALNIALVNVKEIQLYGERIENNIKIGLIRENIEDHIKNLKENTKDLVQEIKDNLSKQTEEMKEYNLGLIKALIKGGDRYGGKKDKRNN